MKSIINKKKMRKLSGNTIISDTGSAEDSMKIAAVRYDSQDMVDKKMYYNCAQRTVFNNCMDSCDIAHENIPNFNSNFYYN